MRTAVIKRNLFFLFSIFCLVLGQGVPSFAHSIPMICSPYFSKQSIYNGLSKPLTPKLYHKKENLSSNMISNWKHEEILESQRLIPFLFSNKSFEPTVKINYPVPASSNLKQVILVRSEGMPWTSLFSTFEGKQDIQGNPTTSLIALGEYTSYVLSFRILDSNRIMVPLTEEFNTRITLLSKKLIQMGYEPIPLRFYTQNELSESSYLERFLKSTELPLANVLENNLFIHDVSFHYSSILLPPIYFKALQQRINFTFNLIEHLKTVEIPTELEPYRYSYIHELINRLTTTVDIVTANVGLILSFESLSSMRSVSQKQLLNALFNFRLDGKLSQFAKDFLAKASDNSDYSLILSGRYKELNDADHLTSEIKKRRDQFQEASIQMLHTH